MMGQFFTMAWPHKTMVWPRKPTMVWSQKAMVWPRKLMVWSGLDNVVDWDQEQQVDRQDRQIGTPTSIQIDRHMSAPAPGPR
jgi:hypothetical protein